MTTGDTSSAIVPCLHAATLSRIACFISGIARWECIPRDGQGSAKRGGTTKPCRTKGSYSGKRSELTASGRNWAQLGSAVGHNNAATSGSSWCVSSSCAVRGLHVALFDSPNCQWPLFCRHACVDCKSGAFSFERFASELKPSRSACPRGPGRRRRNAACMRHSSIRSRPRESLPIKGKSASMRTT
jgi:hypothetical protein